MCGFRIPVRIPVRSVLVTMNGDQLRSGRTLTVGKARVAGIDEHDTRSWNETKESETALSLFQGSSVFCFL